MRVIQITSGDEPDIIKKCMASVKEVYPFIEVYKIDTGPLETMYSESDRLRFKLCAESVEPVLYLDWDTMLTAPLALPDSPQYKKYPSIIGGEHLNYNRMRKRNEQQS